MTTSTCWRLGWLILGVLAILTRFWHLGDPPFVIFDEMHNVTMATQYLSGRPFIDVHPPVARWHFAVAAVMAGAAPDARFEKILLPYGNFPYRALRAVSATAGSLLVIFLALLTKEVTGSRRAALLAGFFVVFDNSLTLYSRLILPDIFLLFYGVAGLWCYFRHDRYAYMSRAWYVWLLGAGLLFSFSAGVKATGLIFPVVAGAHSLAQVRRHDNFYPYRMLAWLLGLPCLMVIIFILVHFMLLDSTGLVYSTITDHPVAAFTYLRENNPGLRFGRFSGLICQRLGETFLGYLVTLGGATMSGVDETATASLPWQWALMQKQMTFAVFRQGDNWRVISLVGNPMIWWGGLLALGGWLYNGWREKKIILPFAIIPLGYLVYLLVTSLIGRPLFLYNYLPALLFLIIILARQAAKWRMARPYALYVFMAGVVMAFLYLSPYTYGLSLSTEQWRDRVAISWLNPLADAKLYTVP